MRVCDGFESLQSASRAIGDGTFSFELDTPVEMEGQVWQTYSGGEGAEQEGKGAWNKDGIEGHRGRICSRCCVEKGAEGDVWCLGCLRSQEGAS
jgi:hypothetical protein